MATQQPKSSANVIETLATGVFSIPRLPSADMDAPENKKTLTPDHQLAPLDDVLNTNDDGIGSEEEKVPATKRHYYCICGQELKLYPQNTALSKSSTEHDDDDQGIVGQHIGQFRRFLFERTESYTRHQQEPEGDHEVSPPPEDDDGDAADEKKEEESMTPIENQGDEPQSLQDQATLDVADQCMTNYMMDEDSEKDIGGNVTKIEDGMTKQIELQQPTDSGAKLQDEDSPKPQNVVHEDDSDEDEEEKNLEEESKQRRERDVIRLKSTTYIALPDKQPDDIDFCCHSCDTVLKLSDKKCKRYECDDYKCYTKKHKDEHIQYCEACYHQLDTLLHLERRYEEFVFREDGFEIQTETEKAQREHSITETSRSRDTRTKTPTNLTSELEDTPKMTPMAAISLTDATTHLMLSPTYNDTSAADTPSPAYTPDPPAAPSDASTTFTRDWYKFNVKYRKMLIDHSDKQSNEEKKTKHGDEKEMEDKMILQPMKAVICYPSNDPDPDRVCYIKVDINHLSISEKWETGNAECDVQLTVKLYWMLSERDYVKYNQLKRKNKRKNLLFYRDEIKFTFQPKIDFHSAIGNKEHQEQQQVRLRHIKDFFGDDLLKNLNIKSKNYPWCKIKKLMFGYMAEMTYNCEITIYEPFEIENFPFDCQDIPIIIEPDTFDVLAPAYFDRRDKSFVTVTGDATNLGRWKMANTITEFINKESNDKNSLRIMLKLKRRSSPYLLEHGFLIAAVCFVSLSAFTIDAIGDEMKHERLAIVLGLILTLIFIDLPAVPRVTLLHWYFYMSFGFLILMAMHFSLETYYSPLLLRLEDKACYEDSDDCAWYQGNNYNSLYIIVFATLYLIEHIIFIIVSVLVNAEENKKLQMNSEKIKKTVEGDQYRIETLSQFRSDRNANKLIYERNGSTDVFGGYQLMEEDDGDDVGSIERAKYLVLQRHQEFNRNRDKIADITERLIFLIFMIASFMLLPLAVSIAQFMLIEFEECEVEHSFKMEQFAMILCSGAQSVLCLLCTLFWFGCCTGPCAQFVFWRSLPVLIIVIVGNYVLGIRSYVVYHWEEVECNGHYRDVLYWLFLSWILLYGLMFSFTLIRISFTEGYVERKGWINTADAEVVALKKRARKYQKMIEDKNSSFDIRDKLRIISWEYFGFKMFTTSLPVFIQYPATIVLLILLGDQCHNNSEIITDKQGIALMVLSLVFLLARSLLQGNDSYFFYFTYFITGNVVINILSIRALIFAEMFIKNSQCKETVLYHVLWWLMFFWVIHDNVCIVGVVYEIISNYVVSFIQSIRAKRGINFKRFIAMVVISVVLILHLPAFVGQYYIILKNETQSPVQLTSAYCILCIIIVWIQVLIYRLMQTTQVLREFAAIPMLIFVSFIFLFTMKSLVFWISVESTTVTSVLFATVYAVCILLDIILLAPPTFAIPIVAWYAYDGSWQKSGSLRSMAALLVMFLGVQLPACIIQLVPIWNGDVEKISQWEGEVLLLLTWVKLLVEFMYTYLYFDTKQKAQDKVHKGVDWDPYRTGMKYVVFAVSSVVNILAIHCFLYWAKEAYLGALWWLFIIWILQYVLVSIAPSVGIIWYMLQKSARWINLPYVVCVLLLYALIQLPASIAQLYMVEFNRCFNQIGHTLDKSSAESFTILIFTFMQIILFYAIIDIIGWTDEQYEEMRKKDNKEYRMRELAAEKAAAKGFVRYDEWQERGFLSREDFKRAVKKSRKKTKYKRWKKRFKKHHGPIIYTIFGVLSAVQFGLVIHSYSYWNAEDKEIDCGCKYNLDPDCDDLYTERKVQLKWLFLLWIIMYVVGVIGGILIAVYRFSGRKWEHRKTKKNRRHRNNKRRKAKSSGNGRPKSKPQDTYQPMMAHGSSNSPPADGAQLVAEKPIRYTIDV